MNILYVVFIVTTVFIGLTFTYMNSQMVEIRYLSFHAELDLVILLVYTLVLGTTIGFFACLLSSLKVRRDLSKAKKVLKNQPASQSV